MAMSSSSNSKQKWLPFLLLLVGQVCLEHAIAGSVDFLPGFEGTLPFQLETGYVGIDEGEDVQVFYYFVKSESNPKEDPLMLWMTGGPGCSALTALLYEIGPVMFKMEEYNGSLPTLLSNANSWTKLELLAELVTYKLSKIISLWENAGNEAGLDKYINFKGYLLGNPLTFPSEDNYKVQFSHGMGLIPDELLESLKSNCGEEYREQYLDPNNLQCLQNLKAYDECMDGIHPDQVLEHECGADFLTNDQSFTKRRTLDERINELYNSKHSLSTFSCRNEGYSLAEYWANDKSVRHALHIQKGSTTKWKRCNKIPTATMLDVRSFHLNLSKKDYRALIYSGDHDMVVPHQSTQAWIRDLNFSIVEQWRSWRLVNRQIAGYTRTYSNNMTFATIKGGGHTAPEYRPEECFTMFKRWISYQTL